LYFIIKHSRREVLPFNSFVSHWSTYCYNLFITTVVIGCESNVCTWTTGETAGKQRSTGAHQQRFEHLPGKEKIIFSQVCALIRDYLFLFVLLRGISHLAE